MHITYIIMRVCDLRGHAPMEPIHQAREIPERTAVEQRDRGLKLQIPDLDDPESAPIRSGLEFAARRCGQWLGQPSRPPPMDMTPLPETSHASAIATPLPTLSATQK